MDDSAQTPVRSTVPPAVGLAPHEVKQEPAAPAVNTAWVPAPDSLGDDDSDYDTSHLIPETSPEDAALFGDDGGDELFGDLPDIIPGMELSTVPKRSAETPSPAPPASKSPRLE